MSPSTDSVLRAMTNDGAFRVIVARTTETVQGALRAQQAEGRTAQHFGDLLTGAILFRETMAPPLRVQGIVKGAGGRGSLLADSHPSGKTRGLVQLPRGERGVDLSQGAVMQVMRTLPGGRINQGVVEVPSTGGISQAFMAYMQISEQVVSMLALGTVLEGDSVESAGGYLVQLLPEVGREPLAIMTERLRGFESIDARIRNASFTPEWLLEQLLYDMPYTRLEESGVGFDCWCDELRLVAAISSLSRSDIEHLLLGGDVLEITCDYCGKEYRISPATLRGLLQES